MVNSFIPYHPHHHFPIQNLPLGIFEHRGLTRAASRIGDRVIDLSLLWEKGHFPGIPQVFNRPHLNEFLSLGPTTWKAFRSQLTHLFSRETQVIQGDRDLYNQICIPIKEVDLKLPVDIKDYTDFYSSKYHAQNVGTMFRGKENALMPNWCHLPVAYHGRASSVVVSGTPVHRPQGQIKLETEESPIHGPCGLLDFELEMGFFTGPPTPLGPPLPIDRTKDHIFGMVLVNDWSARDIQKWEYQPLGPFNAKNFATSISPWIIPLAALEPFACKGPTQSPSPLAYLKSKGDNAFDIHLEIHLTLDNESHCISQTNAKHLYWNIFQQLAHHTVTGCNISPGDLMASGTISGPTPDSCGSLLELTWGGSRPLKFPNGQSRTFLQDGDEITLTGWCQGDGYRVGFGEVKGTILPPL